MTDLTTRIADVKKKAEAWNRATSLNELSAANLAFNEAASPGLILAMEAEIARLTAEADWWKKEGTKLLQQKAALTAQLEKAREALEPFAGAWNRAIDFADSLEAVTDDLYYSTAARVHAELAEKEKEG